MGDISIKGHSPILRQGYAIGGVVKKLARHLKRRKGKEKWAKKVVGFKKQQHQLKKEALKANVHRLLKKVVQDVLKL